MERKPHRSRGARLIEPGLVMLFVTGVVVAGVALASQQAPADIRSAGEPAAIVRPSELATTRAPQPIRHSFDAREPAFLSASTPVSLDIDALGLHSKLHDVGLDRYGAIEAPSGELYDQAAWYRHSPTPGSIGPAIIVGHVDSAARGPSVFFRLAELAPGDPLSVTRADGSVAVFEVDAVRRYPKDEFPTDLVYGDLDHAGLRLITCGGVFDRAAGHYEDNIVVFASLTTKGS